MRDLGVSKTGFVQGDRYILRCATCNVSGLEVNGSTPRRDELREIWELRRPLVRLNACRNNARLREIVQGQYDNAFPFLGAHEGHDVEVTSYTHGVVKLPNDHVHANGDSSPMVLPGCPECQEIGQRAHRDLTIWELRRALKEVAFGRPEVQGTGTCGVVWGSPDKPDARDSLELERVHDVAVAMLNRTAHLDAEGAAIVFKTIRTAADLPKPGDPLPPNVVARPAPPTSEHPAPEPQPHRYRVVYEVAGSFHGYSHDALRNPTATTLKASEGNDRFACVEWAFTAADACAQFNAWAEGVNRVRNLANGSRSRTMERPVLISIEPLLQPEVSK